MKQPVPYIVTFMVVLVGIFFSTNYPKQWGLYALCGKVVAPMVGMLPAITYHWEFTREELAQANLQGQHALVTGANSGIGYFLTKGLVELGAASVTLACRDPMKCNQAAQQIRDECPDQTKTVLRTLTIDMSSLSSVKRAAEEFVETMNGAPLDMLFLNAGTMFADMSAECVPESEDGIEYVFATNHVGHHLLYRSLEPLLQKSDMARIVSTSSAASFATYSYRVATDLETLNGCSERIGIPMLRIINYSYGQSKLAQILWTKELVRRSPYIYANAFHPGGVDTAIIEKARLQAKASTKLFYSMVDWGRLVLWNGKDGAHTGLFLGAQQDYLRRHRVLGNYYHPQGHLIMNPSAEDPHLQKELWEFSDSLVRDFLPAKSTNNVTNY